MVAAMSAEGPPRHPCERGATASAGGLAYAGDELLRVEEAGLNALQTQRQLFYDGWLLRASPGNARRARSVNAHFGSTLPLDTKIEFCERFYARHRLPTLFRITPFRKPADLETALERHGYVAFDTTLVQLASLARPPDLPCERDIALDAPPIAEFVAQVGAMRGSTAAQAGAHLERLSQTPLPILALVARVDGNVVGAGQIALEDDLAGLYDVITESASQGRGIATAIVNELLLWAWNHGATRAYLQVDSANAPALGVYRKFGFATAYTYHYRARPEEMA
jgi:GNAT superfamily N-acetyltransferase